MTISSMRGCSRRPPEAVVWTWVLSSKRAYLNISAGLHGLAAVMLKMVLEAFTFTYRRAGETQCRLACGGEAVEVCFVNWRENTLKSCRVMRERANHRGGRPTRGGCTSGMVRIVACTKESHACGGGWMVRCVFSGPVSHWNREPTPAVRGSFGFGEHGDWNQVTKNSSGLPINQRRSCEDSVVRLLVARVQARGLRASPLHIFVASRALGRLETPKSMGHCIQLHTMTNSALYALPKA
jgi:hypothetical protein